MKKTATKEYEITIEKEVVDNVRKAHVEYERIKDIIISLMDSRRNDTGLFSSPAFLIYEAKQAEAKKEFENRKKDVQNRYIPQWLRDYGCTWNLDYNTYKLSICFTANTEIERKIGAAGYKISSLQKLPI